MSSHNEVSSQVVMPPAKKQKVKPLPKEIANLTAKDRDCLVYTKELDPNINSATYRKTMCVATYVKYQDSKNDENVVRFWPLASLTTLQICQFGRTWECQGRWVKHKSQRQKSDPCARVINCRPLLFHSPGTSFDQTEISFGASPWNSTLYWPTPLSPPKTTSSASEAWKNWLSNRYRWCTV